MCPNPFFGVCIRGGGGGVGGGGGGGGYWNLAMGGHGKYVTLASLLSFWLLNRIGQAGGR